MTYHMCFVPVLRRSRASLSLCVFQGIGRNVCREMYGMMDGGCQSVLCGLVLVVDSNMDGFVGWL
jgi:hypothetical protein